MAETRGWLSKVSPAGSTKRSGYRYNITIAKLRGNLPVLLKFSKVSPVPNSML